MYSSVFINLFTLCELLGFPNRAIYVAVSLGCGAASLGDFGTRRFGTISNISFLEDKTNKLLRKSGHQSPSFTAHNPRETGVCLYLLCNKFMCKVIEFGTSCPATIFAPVNRNLCVTRIMAMSLKLSTL